MLWGEVLCCKFVIHVEKTVDEICNFWSRKKGMKKLRVSYENDSLQLKYTLKLLMDRHLINTLICAVKDKHVHTHSYSHTH